MELRTPEFIIRTGTWAMGRGGVPSPSAVGGPVRPAPEEPILKSLDLDSFEYEVSFAKESMHL